MTKIKTSVRITAIVVSAIYTIVLLLVGVKLDSWLKTLLGFLPTIGVVLVIIFDVWVWKLPFVQRFLHRPLLAGTWRATLTPGARSAIPDGGNRGPIEAYVVIEQTFWTIAVTLLSVESSSRSRAASFIPRQDSRAQILSFVYENVPRLEYRDRSPRHVGTCELAIEGRSPTIITGEYFTDRFTAGEMRLEFCGRSTEHADFAAAKSYCDGGGRSG